MKQDNWKKTGFLYYEKLYMGGRHFSRRDLARIESGRPLQRSCVVLLSESEEENFEIIRAGENLVNELALFERTNVYVVGVARSRRMAFFLVEEIFLEHIGEAGRLREFFREQPFLPLEELVL